jgi:hypothetical protein
MTYRVTIFEPQSNRRDFPKLGYMGQTHRTEAMLNKKPEAVDLARELVNKHAEVTIWYEVKGVGKPIKDWLPADLIILDSPREIRVEHNRKSSRDQRRRVDWHLYEYRGSNGERYRKTFETIKGEDPRVPLFGSHTAINLLQYQWQCWNCGGTGSSGRASEKSGEPCYACEGSGRRETE